jgi:phospholipid transport system substrate-binding protein
MLKKFVTMALLSVSAMAWASSPAEALVSKVSAEVVEAVKADKDIQAGDIAKVITLVDAKVMPHVDFARMTGIAVGLPWRNATPEQRERLMAEFKTTLIRTYAGALTLVKDQSITVKGARTMANQRDMEVMTDVRGKGDKVELNYRMTPADGGAWRIFDLSVGGVWMADTTFKSQWAPIVSKSGIDGLIAHLSERNKAAAK